MAPADWFEWYSRRTEEGRLPRSDAKRAEYAHVVGQDRHHLLTLVERVEAPSHLGSLSSIQTLRPVWREQYEQESEADEDNESAGAPVPLRLTPSCALCRASLAAIVAINARFLRLGARRRPVSRSPSSPIGALPAVAPSRRALRHPRDTA